MSSTDCPYCSLANKKGELYCSRHSNDMASLKSGIFLINGARFEKCDEHRTRLSLNFNLDEEQIYSIGNRDHKVSPSRYLLIEEGQSFRTGCNTARPGRMLTIAYQVGLAEQMYSALVKNDDILLETHETHERCLFLFDQTFPMDPYFTQRVTQLSSEHLFHNIDNLDHMLEEILESVLHKQASIQREVSRIKKVKANTKREIYRRLRWAVDYTNDNLSEDLSIADIAHVACMSPYHFKKVFKQVFNEPPYQYIKRKRIEKARMLLTAGLSITEVCRMAGWQDASSFIRLFKKEHTLTPGEYQAKYLNAANGFSREN